MFKRLSINYFYSLENALMEKFVPKKSLEIFFFYGIILAIC